MSDIFYLRLSLPYCEEFYNSFLPRATAQAVQTATALADTYGDAASQSIMRDLKKYMEYSALNYIEQES